MVLKAAAVYGAFGQEFKLKPSGDVQDIETSNAMELIWRNPRRDARLRWAREMGTERNDIASYPTLGARPNPVREAGGMRIQSSAGTCEVPARASGGRSSLRRRGDAPA